MRKTVVAFMMLLGFAAYGQESIRTTTEIIDDLRSKTSELVKTNEELVNINNADKSTIEELSARVGALAESIDKASNDLSEANEKLIRQDEKIKTQRAVLLVLTAILGLFFVAHIAVLILNFKFGITLPYWLNSLL